MSLFLSSLNSKLFCASLVHTLVLLHQSFFLFTDESVNYLIWFWGRSKRCSICQTSNPQPPLDPPLVTSAVKVTVQFERCFRLMEHISVILCRNPINLYITVNLIKFSKSLFNFYLVILTNKENERLLFRPLFSLSGVPSRTCCV